MGDYGLQFNLAPPLLAKRDEQTGQLLKKQYGPWMMKAFGLLAKLKSLRGGPFDVFGYTAERRQEREDIEDYCRLLDTVMALVNEDNYDAALELARLPLKLRGFGHVKDRNRDNLAQRRESLLRALRGEADTDAVKIVEAA